MSDPFTPTYELENPTVNFFNMIDFRRFLVENKVIVTAVSFTIATYINELVKSFYDNLIFSFFNKDTDGDKKNDLKHIFTYELNINGIPFKLGLFLMSLIKFMLAILLAFYISRALNDAIN